MYYAQYLSPFYLRHSTIFYHLKIGTSYIFYSTFRHYNILYIVKTCYYTCIVHTDRLSPTLTAWLHVPSPSSLSCWLSTLCPQPSSTVVHSDILLIHISLKPTLQRLLRNQCNSNFLFPLFINYSPCDTRHNCVKMMQFRKYE